MCGLVSEAKDNIKAGKWTLGPECFIAYLFNFEDRVWIVFAFVPT